MDHKDFDNRDYVLVELKNHKTIDSVVDLHSDWQFEYTIKELDSFHVFSLPRNHEDLTTFKELSDINEVNLGLFKRSEDLAFVEKLKDSNVNGIHLLPKKRLSKRAPVPIDFGTGLLEERKEDSIINEQNEIAQEFQINDPIFKDQWHIFNTQFPSNDVNVIPVWRMNITGNGVVTALIDDGLDYDSPDLKESYCAEGSYDFNDNRSNPKPMLVNDYHGTRCAAEIAASKGNGYCGVGVAFNSKVAGIRILSGEITAEEEAKAMIYGLDVNDIYSCSWGPTDNGKTMDAPDKLIRAAMIKGVQEGRGGKGALYVFASGNGGQRGDSCNFDGYTNSIYSLTVSAIDHKGLHPPYSEECAAVLVSTYSSGSGEHIHTTDINDKCAANHGGTSAAAPLAAGIYALILEANPELTWRDVQYLTVLSAAEIDPYDPSWQPSSIENRRYSPKYGWGKIDAEKMVNMAKDNWTLLKPQSWYYTPYLSVGESINNVVEEVEHSFEITDKLVVKSNFEKIEQLTVTVDIKSSKRGDVEVDLVSPNGIVSKLAYQRLRDTDKFGFKKWTFSTVAHWGETLSGNWTLKVRNMADTNSLTFEGWQLKAFGECVDPALAKRFDMNEDYSKVNFEDDSDLSKTSSTSTSISMTSSISFTSSTFATAISSMVSATPSSILPINGTAPTEDESPQIDDGIKENPDHSKHYVGYFSLLILIGFLLILFIMKNRRKIGRARRREDFEFDIITPDDESSRFEFEDDDGFNEYNEFDEDNNEFEIDDEHDEFDENHRVFESSELDLGSSDLPGYEKTKDIIDIAKSTDTAHLNKADSFYDHLKDSDEADTLDHEKDKLFD